MFKKYLQFPLFSSYRLLAAGKMKRSLKKLSLLNRHVKSLTAQILFGHQYLWNGILEGTFSIVDQSINKCSILFTLLFNLILHLLHKASVNFNCYIFTVIQDGVKD